jgi:hypothetical protein
MTAELLPKRTHAGQEREHTPTAGRHCMTAQAYGSGQGTSPSFPEQGRRHQRGAWFGKAVIGSRGNI